MDDARIDEFRSGLRQIKEETNEKYVYRSHDIDEVDKLIKTELLKKYHEIREHLVNESPELKKVLMYYLDLDLLMYNNTLSQERIDELEQQNRNSK